MPRLTVRDFSSCLSFDGATTDVTVTSQLFYQNTSYSVSFWVKGSPLASAAQRYIAVASTASNNQVVLLESSIASRKIKLFIRNDANLDISPASPISISNVLTGDWVHVVMTDANGTVKMYLNSILDTNNFNYTRSGVFTINRTGIGALVRGTASTWVKGKMDDVRLFNSTILSQSDVNNLYFLGMNPSTPTSWYKFDEGSGTTALDSGSLATNGVITAATYSTDVFIKPRSLAGMRTTAGTRTLA